MPFIARKSSILPATARVSEPNLVSCALIHLRRMESDPRRAAGQVYNGVLRQLPGDGLFQRLRAGGNLFATTVHVLVSAVVKLARAVRLPAGLELYRGLGAVSELPEGFSKADKHGRRGYMEWGFLSTTTHRAVAVQVGRIGAASRMAGVGFRPGGCSNRVFTRI